jgi:hypothetical protein
MTLRMLLNRMILTMIIKTILTMILMILMAMVLSRALLMMMTLKRNLLLKDGKGVKVKGKVWSGLLGPSASEKYDGSYYLEES